MDNKTTFDDLLKLFDLLGVEERTKKIYKVILEFYFKNLNIIDFEKTMEVTENQLMNEVMKKNEITRL